MRKSKAVAWASVGIGTLVLGAGLMLSRSGVVSPIMPAAKAEAYCPACVLGAAQADSASSFHVFKIGAGTSYTFLAADPTNSVVQGSWKADHGTISQTGS